MPSASFTANAVIAGGRLRHDINNDHFGALSDLYIAIESPIGPWPEGTPVHYVLEDLFLQIVGLESTNWVIASFVADAVIAPHITADAVIFRADMSGSFVLEAWLAGGGSITVDAVLQGFGTITADAVFA